jgi:outer membrane protein TolC
LPGNLRETSGQVGVQLQIPLNTSGLAYSQLRQAKQTNSQDLLSIANTERAVTESVVDSWEALRSARATIASSREQVRANSVALEGVRQEAQVGSRTTLDVLNAEQLLLSSQVTLATAQHNEVVAAYQLLSAIGKLTAADLGLAVALYDPQAYYNDVRNRWFGADVQ